jgi:cephalosporin-C deacetylase
MPLRRQLLFSLCSSFWAALQAVAAEPSAALTLTADHTNCLYKQGETIVFMVELTPGAVVTNAALTWKISKDGVAPVRTGPVSFVDGKCSLAGRLDEPGFLLCQVTGKVNGQSANALRGAGIAPLFIKPSLPPPEDFDTFWSGQKKKLAEVPMNPNMTPVTAKAATNLECFDVQVQCAGPAPVSGYYARPKGATPKSLPAILLVHGAGVQSSSLPNSIHWAERGLLAMDINAHGIPNGKPQQYYKDLAQGTLKEYWHAGRESRESCYFLGMFLRVIRAIDFLTAQPEWDGKAVVVYGSSQGGFQAFAAAGLDERVSFIAAGVPAGCDHTGMKANRVSGWPKSVPTSGDGTPDEKVLQAARYFDNVNFAARARTKGAFVTVGFIDTTCPPTTVYAAYNNLPIPKQIFNDLPTGHANSPAATEARDKAVFDYIKSVR